MDLDFKIMRNIRSDTGRWPNPSILPLRHDICLTEHFAIWEHKNPLTYKFSAVHKRRLMDLKLPNGRSGCEGQLTFYISRPLSAEKPVQVLFAPDTIIIAIISQSRRNWNVAACLFVCSAGNVDNHSNRHRGHIKSGYYAIYKFYYPV